MSKQQIYPLNYLLTRMLILTISKVFTFLSTLPGVGIGNTLVAFKVISKLFF